MDLASSQSPETPVGRPAAFFDRDGVLNVDHGYVHDPSALDLVSGAVEAVKLCNQAGYLVLVATNQSGVARGFFDDIAVESFHRALIRRFADEGAHIDDIRYCPHHPTAGITPIDCECRKPKPGLLLELARTWGVDRARAFMIGDKESDMAAARAAGIRGLLFDGHNLAGLVNVALANQATEGN